MRTVAALLLILAVQGCDRSARSEDTGEGTKEDARQVAGTEAVEKPREPEIPQGPFIAKTWVGTAELSLQDPDAGQAAQATAEISMTVSNEGVVEGSVQLPGGQVRLTGRAELPRGPVRVRLVSDWQHGTLFLEESKGELLGSVVFSWERGRKKSQLSSYFGRVKLEGRGS